MPRSTGASSTAAEATGPLRFGGRFCRSLFFESSRLPAPGHSSGWSEHKRAAQSPPCRSRARVRRAALRRGRPDDDRRLRGRSKERRPLPRRRPASEGPSSGSVMTAGLPGAGAGHLRFVEQRRERLARRIPHLGRSGRSGSRGNIGGCDDAGRTGRLPAPWIDETTGSRKGADQDEHAEPDPKAQKRAGRHGADAVRAFTGIVGVVVGCRNKGDGRDLRPPSLGVHRNRVTAGLPARLGEIFPPWRIVGGRLFRIGRGTAKIDIGSAAGRDRAQRSSAAGGPTNRESSGATRDDRSGSARGMRRRLQRLLQRFQTGRGAPPPASRRSLP